MIKNTFGAAALALFLAGPASAISLQSSYTADVVFTDALASTTMTIAYDGNSYWSTSGGTTNGPRLAQYDSNGGLVQTYAPGFDFRSVFTDANGDVMIRPFNNNTLHRQTAPGQFAADVTLTGGTVDAQSSVVQNDDGEYVSMLAGNVQRFDANGQFLGSFSLNGFFDFGYPSNRGIAAAGDYLLTYDETGSLSVWDYSGNIVGVTTLDGAGTSFDSLFSLSYANDRVFIVDAAGGEWRGYNLGIAPVPVPASGLLLIAGIGAAFALRRTS